jgi:hypothetical protein
MAVYPEDSSTGNDTIDALIGAHYLTANIEDPAERVRCFKSTVDSLQRLGLVTIDDIYGRVFDINAAHALLPSKDRAEDQRGLLTNVEIVGAFSLQKTFKYIEEDEIPYEGIAIHVVNPLFIGFNPVEELGFTPQIAELPLETIYRVEAA